MALPVVEPPSSLLYQSHRKTRGPLNFNPTPRGRFNAPHGEYGTTYLSTSPEGAFVETFVQDAQRADFGPPLVTQARLDAYCQSHLSIALFDRAQGVLTADCSTNLLTDPRQRGPILRHYSVGLVP